MAQCSENPPSYAVNLQIVSRIVILPEANPTHVTIGAYLKIALLSALLVVAIGQPSYASPRAGLAEESNQLAPPETRNAPASLVLGTVVAERATTATVPVYFERSGNPARTVRLEVIFVSNSVKYTRAEKGPAAQLENFDLSVTASELAAAEEKSNIHTRLTIEAAVLDPDAKKVLPDGTLIFLSFGVSQDAKAYSIALNPESISALDSTRQPVEVTAKAGKIIIAAEGEAILSCFFFTH